MKNRDTARFKSSGAAPMSVVKPAGSGVSDDAWRGLVALRTSKGAQRTLGLGVADVPSIQTVEEVEKGEQREEGDVHLAVNSAVDGGLAGRIGTILLPKTERLVVGK